MLALLLTTAALAAPLRVVDVGRPDDGRGPVALLVQTPGVAPRAFAPLVAALELGGLDVYTVRVPVAAQDPAWLVAAGLPAALAALPDRPRVLVGHGLGGTLAAQAALALEPAARPDALALLGAPLATQPRRVFDWLAEQHPDGAPVHLAPAADAKWGEQPVGPLLLGGPLPLTRLSGAMADTYLGWGRGGLGLDLAPLASLPVWAGAGSEDNLAPVESIRPALAASHRFVRYGTAALMPQPMDHVGLLQRSRPARDLARWAVAVTRDAPGAR